MNNINVILRKIKNYTYLIIIYFLFCSFTYPSNFNKMMVHILKFEGGFTMIDPGGTNYGIMQKNYDSYRLSKKLEKKSVEFITMDEVYYIYYYNYYLPSGADTLKDELSFIHFDTAINCGVKQASKFIKKLNTSTVKESAIKYVDLRDNFYIWLGKNRDKQRFVKGWLNRDKQIRIIIENY